MRIARASPRSVGHTHAHASNVRPGVVEKRYHMPPLCHRALQTWIERITGEEGEKGWLVGIFGSTAVLVDDGLKTGCTSYGFCGSGSKRTTSVMYAAFLLFRFLFSAASALCLGGIS